MINRLHSLLLADDDPDDCTFFKDALAAAKLPAQLNIVNNGADLMLYLRASLNNLPEIIFLDLNMPGKSGFECLDEIKGEETLKHIPVVIFSTSPDRNNTESLYENGAHYYIRKPADFIKLQEVIKLAIDLISATPGRPDKEKFVLA